MAFKEITLLILDLIIILTFIMAIKYLIFKLIDSMIKNNELAQKIKMPVFISVLLVILFLPALFIQSNAYAIADKEFNDFEGFVHYPSFNNKKPVIALLTALKENRDKIKHIDLITGYTTPYITANNQSNLQNANIVRIFYSDDKTQCISDEKYKKYFGSSAYIQLRMKTKTDTPDDLCLAEQEIAYSEASKYEYAPPLIKASHNQTYFYFFPFMHTITNTFPVIAETHREKHALENIHHENFIMEYVSVVSEFGTIQNVFGKHFRPSDETFIKEFLKHVSKNAQ